MKVPLFFLLPVLLFLCSCDSKALQSQTDPLDRILACHETSQLKQFQMKLVSAGISSHDEIERFALHYVTFQKMKIPQARKLIVASVEEFLDRINQEEALQDRLKHQPITYKDIQFNIGFGAIDGTFQEPPYVAYACLEEGVIHYCYEDRLFLHFTEEKNVQEEYAEARAIIQQMQVSP